MKKSLLALTFAASLGLAACSNPADEVVVSTEFGDITQGEFYNEIKALAGPALLEQVVISKILSEKYEVTDEQVDEMLQSYKDQYADQFDSLLAMNGYTEATFKDSLRFQLLQQEATKDVEITDEEINNYYEQTKYELNARHILVQTAEEAQAIYEELRADGDFAAIAKEKSQDPASGEKGGDLGWFTVGTMVTEFNDAAYALEKDEISQPVQSSHGYHIIQLMDKREVADVKPLEEVKEEITQKIKEQKAMNTDWATVEARLLKEAKIDIKDKDLSSAFADPNATDEEGTVEEDKEEDKKEDSK